MKIRFDRDLITQRMNDLGLSERVMTRIRHGSYVSRPLVSHTGFPQFTFRQARKTGEFEGTLTLKQLTALADTLGLSLAQLLSTDDAEEHGNHSTSAQQDAALLIHYSLTCPRWSASTTSRGPWNGHAHEFTKRWTRSCLPCQTLACAFTAATVCQDHRRQPH